VPLFSRRLRPVPLQRPDIEALVFPDHEPLRKRREDVLRVTKEALDRAGTLRAAASLTPELVAFAESFTAELSALSGPGDAAVLSRESALPQVMEAVKLGAAFAEPVELPKPPLYARVDPVTACAKNFAAYRHTHFEPKDLGIMACFSFQCGFYLSLAGAKVEDVLPPLAGVVDAANRGSPAYEAATSAVDAVWARWVGE
jgi:hypothetical protein